MNRKQQQINTYDMSGVYVGDTLVIADDETLRTTCRGCYGYGDGCCSYHANKFRVLEKRIRALSKHVDTEEE